MLKRATALALLLLAPVTWAAPRDLSEPPAPGDGMRVASAPADLSDAPDILEVSSGLVWLEVEGAGPARTATKVGHGYYLTESGRQNLEASLRRDAARLAELEALVELLHRGQGLRSAQPPVVLVPEGLPVEVPEPLDHLPVAAPSPHGGLRVWHVVVGVGLVLVAGFAVGRATE